MICLYILPIKIFILNNIFPKLRIDGNYKKYNNIFSKFGNLNSNRIKKLKELINRKVINDNKLYNKKKQIHISKIRELENLLDNIIILDKQIKIKKDKQKNKSIINKNTGVRLNITYLDNYPNYFNIFLNSQCLSYNRINGKYIMQTNTCDKQNNTQIFKVLSSEERRKLL